MTQRLDKIGELLAKGIYLYLKNEEEKTAKDNDNGNTKDNKVIPMEAKKNIS